MTLLPSHSLQVIRLAPNLPDPYHTLGLLHEAVGDVKKVGGSWSACSNVLACPACLPPLFSPLLVVLPNPPAFPLA